MLRAMAALLIAAIFATIPVGLPANPLSSENTQQSPLGLETSSVLEMVAMIVDGENSQ
ncbi:MAG: hypothetical protein IID51_04605 [Proteobacteria bacterium]|nr:hypothetical protein [Pseudomonadota bacterium]